MSIYNTVTQGTIFSKSKPKNEISLINGKEDYNDKVLTQNYNVLTVVYFDNQKNRSYVQKVADSYPDVRFFRVDIKTFPFHELPQCVTKSVSCMPAFLFYKGIYLVDNFSDHHLSNSVKSELKYLLERHKVRPENKITIVKSDKEYNEKEIVTERNKLMVVYFNDYVESFVQNVADANPDVVFLLVDLKRCRETATRYGFDDYRGYIRFIFYKDNKRVPGVQIYSNYSKLKERLEGVRQKPDKNEIVFISNAGDFKKILNNQINKFTVVAFKDKYADVDQEIANDNRDVLFLHVVAVYCVELQTQYEIDSVPAYAFLYDNECVDIYTCAADDKINNILRKRIASLRNYKKLKMYV